MSISPNPQAGGPPLVGYYSLYCQLPSTSTSRSSIRSLVARTQAPRCQSKALCSTLAAPVTFASICCSTLHQQQRLSIMCQKRKLAPMYDLITSKSSCAHPSELTLTAHPISVLRKCVGLVDRSRMAFRKFRERNSI